MSPRALPWALFAGALVICALTLPFGIQPNDEGLMLQAAARIAAGEVPYRDFWWFYPPGQPLLLGALWATIGPSLVVWRLVRLVADAAVAVLAWRMARQGGAPPAAALVAWLATTLAMAYPTGPHPFPITLALCLGALLAAERRPALAGVLTGAAAFWRLEFAAYLALGVLLAYAARPGGRRGRARQMARYAGAAAAVALVLFAPVVAIAGAEPSFELLVEYPLTDFGDYQSLPFPLDYDGPLNTSSVGGFLSDSAENLLLFYLPLILVVGLVAAVAVLALRFDRDRWWDVAVVVFALGTLHYLLVRPDVFHTAPLAVMVSVLAAWAAGAAAPRIRVAARAATVVAFAALAFAVVEGTDRSWLVLREGGVELEADVADGVRVPEATAGPLEATIRSIRSRVPPDDPIYVATRRSDLVTAGNPLLYVLASRPNPTRYDIQAPGVVTTEPVQREIVRELERSRVRLVIRDTSAVTAAPEPNAAGRSTGVRVLDDYLAAEYRRVERHGPFVVLERR